MITVIDVKTVQNGKAVTLAADYGFPTVVWLSDGEVTRLIHALTTSKHSTLYFNLKNDDLMKEVLGWKDVSKDSDV